jgi:hypothetical protein
MMETLAELPFIGAQVVCLSRDQAARKWYAGEELAELGELGPFSR